MDSILRPVVRRSKILFNERLELQEPPGSCDRHHGFSFGLGLRRRSNPRSVSHCNTSNNTVPSTVFNPGVATSARIAGIGSRAGVWKPDLQPVDQSGSDRRPVVRNRANWTGHGLSHQPSCIRGNGVSGHPRPGERRRELGGPLGIGFRPGFRIQRPLLRLLLRSQPSAVGGFAVHGEGSQRRHSRNRE